MLTNYADHLTVNTSIWSLCCTSTTNKIVYVNYISFLNYMTNKKCLKIHPEKTGIIERRDIWKIRDLQILLSVMNGITRQKNNREVEVLNNTVNRHQHNKGIIYIYSAQIHMEQSVG